MIYGEVRIEIKKLAKVHIESHRKSGDKSSIKKIDKNSTLTHRNTLYLFRIAKSFKTLTIRVLVQKNQSKRRISL
jgi:hypothetical protein